MENESILITDKHILLCMNKEILEHIKPKFCGTIFFDMESFNKHIYLPDTIIYFCGNVEEHYDNIKGNIILVIKEFSNNYNKESIKLINMNELPINFHNVGLFFKHFFDPNKDYFNLVSKEHEFQSLTESNKPSNAFRTGIYLTNITEANNEIKFKLLRCSSNFSGPSDNFRPIDREIIDKVNHISKYFFEGSSELNHVLAQIYNNNKINNKKAIIKAHSDKTKDMPRNGLIAFCTFYKDYSGNNINFFTKLRFRLKDVVQDQSLVKKFDVVLHPNSVFIIPLSTNRLYTHEIVPSCLPIDKIPTRLGYVIRCSKTDAIFKNDQTYICDNGNYVKMEEMNDENCIKQLKNLYYKENTTDNIIHYDKFYFSLNKGDYMKPIM